MSISHPYLKQLKGYIITFCQNNATIKDDNQSLLPFCRTLEDIMRLGLTNYAMQSSNGQRFYWPLLQSMNVLYTTQKLTAPLQYCIEHCDNSTKAIQHRGKERLFIRLALNKGVLALTLRLVKEKKQILNLYYNDSSVIAHEILSELLISMLVPLTQCNFNLNYKNASFLDDTWELPIYKKYELVPCRKLGVYLEQIDGRLVVVDVEAGSVADEDAKIECGDIVDELYGECLRNSSKKKFISLMSEYQGSPIYISVTKCINQGAIFLPMMTFLEQLNMCKNALLSNHKKRMLEVKPGIVPTNYESSNGQKESGSQRIVNERGFYPVKFCGPIFVGSIGSVEQIESGVGEVLKKDEPKMDVLLDLGETDVVACCARTDKILLQHGYPEIASCGRRVDHPLNFAYIAGETTCTLAKKFICYVFEANCEEQARTVLKEIAKGFDRTHWAV